MFTKMMMMKFFLLTMFILSMMEQKNISIELSMLDSSSNFMTFSLSMSKMSKFFIIMVTVVTWTVLSYSNMYMESYNKKKFFFIMMLFFLSMSILSMSNSIMSTITGWDMLGITSIALIMMYQNFNTMSNSLLTMFFNRVGDIFMFFSFSEMLKIMMEETIENKSLYSNYQFMIMLLMAASTKSAQVPLSAWLPAAMSAPTPISAMVHSSTLVTAGIFLFMKMNKSTEMVYPLLSMISGTTILMASLSAITEKDLKKIIAFSTMSQISIVMMMISSLNNKTLAMTHMFNHAMFKTLLFMTAGKVFLENWSNQSNMKSKSFKSSKLTKSSLTASMVSMSGTPFSASFFSKDKFMEMTKWENKMSSKSIILTLASMATIIYSKKILMMMKTTTMNNTSTKKMNKLSFFLMSIFSMLSGSMNLWTMKITKKPILMKKEILILNSIIATSCLINMKLKNKKMLMMFNKMLFMKWMSTNMIYNLNKLSSLNEKINNLITEKTIWKVHNIKKKIYMNKTSKIIPMMMFITFIITMS